MTGANSIVDTVGAELRQAATLPAVWAGAAVTVVGSAGLAVLNAVSVRGAVDSGQADLVYGSSPTSPFESGFTAMPITGVVGALVIGVVVIGSEYTADRAESGGGRQIATTLVASPHRVTLLVAKILSVLALVIATAVVTIPLSVGGGLGGDRFRRRGKCVPVRCSASLRRRDALLGVHGTDRLRLRRHRPDPQRGDPAGRVPAGDRRGHRACTVAAW